MTPTELTAHMDAADAAFDAELERLLGETHDAEPLRAGDAMHRSALPTGDDEQARAVHDAQEVPAGHEDGEGRCGQGAQVARGCRSAGDEVRGRG